MTTSRDVGGQVASIGAIVNDVQSGWALISGAQRNVGGLYPDVTIEELHRDELQITQHPSNRGHP